MGLTDISSSSELDFFLQANELSLVTFSAHWCQPCQKSKPQLEAMAEKDYGLDIAFAYVPDADSGDFADSDDYKITGFPTYVFFIEGSEVGRVQGVDLEAVQAMIEKYKGES